MDLAKRVYVMCRLDRRERWVSLWLTRIAAFLAAAENTALARALHGCLARAIGLLSDCVLDCIAMRAAWSPAYRRRVAQQRATGCAPTISGMKRAKAAPRAVLGGALRRALRAKSLKGRAEALLNILKNRDLWVAYIARRIARGQTRIYSAHARVAKTLPPCHAEAQRAQAGPAPSKLGEDLRGAAGPP